MRYVDYKNLPGLLTKIVATGGLHCNAFATQPCFLSCRVQTLEKNSRKITQQMNSDCNTEETSKRNLWILPSRSSTLIALCGQLFIIALIGADLDPADRSARSMHESYYDFSILQGLQSFLEASFLGMSRWNHHRHPVVVLLPQPFSAFKTTTTCTS